MVEPEAEIDWLHSDYFVFSCAYARPTDVNSTKCNRNLLSVISQVSSLFACHMRTRRQCGNLNILNFRNSPFTGTGFWRVSPMTCLTFFHPNEKDQAKFPFDPSCLYCIYVLLRELFHLNVQNKFYARKGKTRTSQQES